MNLYTAKNPSLANYRLPKLSEYFKELNNENMSNFISIGYTLADRLSRSELWTKARELMMKDRLKLQSKLQMFECTFSPQLVFNPGDERNRHTKAQFLLTVGSVYIAIKKCKKK